MWHWAASSPSPSQRHLKASQLLVLFSQDLQKILGHKAKDAKAYRRIEKALRATWTGSRCWRTPTGRGSYKAWGLSARCRMGLRKWSFSNEATPEAEKQDVGGEPEKEELSWFDLHYGDYGDVVFPSTGSGKWTCYLAVLPISFHLRFVPCYCVLAGCWWRAWDPLIAFPTHG